MLIMGYERVRNMGYGQSSRTCLPASVITFRLVMSTALRLVSPEATETGGGPRKRHQRSHFEGWSGKALAGLILGVCEF